MKLILLERVGRLGSVGDVVTVKSGYGRNWLLPQGKALRATKANQDIFQQRRATIEAENQRKRDEATLLATQFVNFSVVLLRQAGEDGRLFGSVSARDIAIAIREKGITIDRHHVSLQDAIKNIGIYPIALHLHADVHVTIYVNVARTDTEAGVAAKAYFQRDKKTKGPDKGTEASDTAQDEESVS